MKLIIIKPEDKKAYEIVWAEFNTPEGNFVIQAGHASTTLALSDNKEMSYGLKTGKQESLELKHGGIAHITSTEILVLISP